MRKTSKTSVRSGRQNVCLSEWPATPLSGQRRKGSDSVIVGRTETANSDGRGWRWGSACSRVFACVCLRACVRDVFAIYDNDILPRLIMIIIKIIILYFIQIRHTDDFP